MEYKNINYKIYLNESDESGRCSVILYDSNSINDNSDPADLAWDKCICKIEFDSNTGITNSLVYGINPNIMLGRRDINMKRPVLIVSVPTTNNEPCLRFVYK